MRSSHPMGRMGCNEMPAKLFIQTLLSWFKHHWYIPVIAVLALVAYIITRRRDFVDWKRILQEADDAHQQEVKALQTAQDERDAADNRARARAAAVERQVRDEYAKNERVLDVDKEKRVLQIIDGLKHDPQGLANEIEKETGVRVLIVD